MIDRRSNGFTLVELLHVVVIMGVLAMLVVPSVNGLQLSGGFNKTVTDLSLILTQARLYAMAHNTYVYVGIEETNVTASPSAPQTQATSLANGGRIFVAVVATQDGTPGFDPSNPANGWINPATGTVGTNLVSLQKVTFFNNVHLISTVPNSGNLARPGVSSPYQFAAPTFSSYTPFNLPLGSATPVNSFTRVITFDPRGSASVQSSAAGSGIAPWIELGLQPTRGTSGASAKDEAAIQIDGITGSVIVYRP